MGMMMMTDAGEYCMNIEFQNVLEVFLRYIIDERMLVLDVGMVYSGIQCIFLLHSTKSPSNDGFWCIL